MKELKSFKSSTPSAYLPKMHCNEKNMSMRQIMAVLSQQICDMFTVSVPLICQGWMFSLKFWKGGGGRKKWVPVGGIKIPATDICLEQLTMFPVKKDFIKWNMVFRAKFSKVNLGLFLEKEKFFYEFLVLLNHLNNKTRN